VRVIFCLAILCAATLSSTLVLGATWIPPGITPSAGVLADVLALHARAAGDGDPRFAQRHERWSYVNGTHHIPVTVAVRNNDFRTSLELDGLTYMAGRKGGARWRSDGNAIAHGNQADLQGDAVDRAPQALFPLDAATCTLAGEANVPGPVWVVRTEPPGDKPAFLYIDKTTGSVVREVMRDGTRSLTTTFDEFRTVAGGALRPHTWHVADTRGSNDLDVSVDAIEPSSVAVTEVSLPPDDGRRIFAPAAPLTASIDLGATFTRINRVMIPVTINGTKWSFILDTGTTSITVDTDVANQFGGATLEHAVLPNIVVGGVKLDRVSVLTVPLHRIDPTGLGILGFDFFFGHVVEVDYQHQHVRILSTKDADAVFSDPKTNVINANVDQGMPLVHAGFGTAQSDRFALDTGSQRLYVMSPFAEYFANDIRTKWAHLGPGTTTEQYLEGPIHIAFYTASDFTFAGGILRTTSVGVQVSMPTDLDVPFDGIIGTNTFGALDLYFDYDNARLGIRH
jgi:hypothetical protein